VKHTETAAKKREGKSKSAQSRFANQHKGMHSPRIFRIPRKCVIPCNLHAISGITKKLFQLLVLEVEGWPELEAQFESLLQTACNLKLKPKKDQKKDKERFSQRVQQL
jgi:hypothetical protein